MRIFDPKTEVAQAIGDMRFWFSANGGDRPGAVLGISGGKDSTTAAALCVKALGADRVVGVLMPNGEQSDLADAYKVCEELGIRAIEVNINDIFNSMCIPISNHLKLSTDAERNIPPRIRMTVLYVIAQSLGYRVIGTGNKCEIFVGWCTKWGDMASDYNPLKDYLVSEVVAMGKELGMSDYLMDKVPADGITDRSDEANLGFTYPQLEDYIDKGTSGSMEIDRLIFRRHSFSHHKRK